MAISRLRPASAFEVAWRGVSSEDLAGEAAARAAADAALQAAIDAEEAARIADVNTEQARAQAAEAALAADIDAASDQARSELLTEPSVSELASMWSTVLTGEPKDRVNLAASNVVFDGVDGLVIRVTAAGNRAPRAAYRMVPGHKYEVLAMARRKADPVDSTDKSVRLRAMWLTAAKAQISAVDLESFVLLGSGLHLYRKVVSLVAGSEVDVVAAANTVYFTPFIQTFGTDGTTNILPYIRVTDLTSNTLISADVSGLDARLTALESQDLDDRLTAVESLVAGSDIARFETRAKAVSAASAGTILAGVDVLETLGLADGGDDVVRSYSRELADPGFGDRFHDAGGSWWVGRAQGLQAVKGLVELRRIAPVAGRIVYLSYHTTVGDLGFGEFRGVTGAAAGTYVDNTGTVIVPTGGDGSAAWLRVWDGLTAHVGWFGAKCDLVTDDYIPVKKCFGLFTDGRSGLKTGAIHVGPGFAFGTPLVYGGSNSYSIKIFGNGSKARGDFQQSLMKYIGPATQVAVIFYGANESLIENINVWPGIALNGILVTSDNGYIATLSSAVSAGANVVATPSNMTYLQAGAFVGVDAGGDNFEVVCITKVTATTFTATFLKAHAAGAPLGGSAGSSGNTFRQGMLVTPESPVWTTLNADALGGGTQVLTPASMAGIGLGMPIRIGSYLASEIVYPTAVTGSTFTAVCSNSHSAGERIMYATAGVLVGNHFTATTQVSELTFDKVHFTGSGDHCYAGVRQISGGNTKNIICHTVKYTYLMVPFAFEASSGQYLINGCVGAAAYDTVIVCGAVLTVMSLEDESESMLLRGNSGSNPIHATFIGCTLQSQVPVAAHDEIVAYSGALTFIGCFLQNARTGSSLPKIVVFDMRFGVRPSSLALVNCFVQNATETSGFVRDASTDAGGGVDVIADGTGKLTMLGCTGGVPGAVVGLPNVIPPLSRWQNMATYDPPSLAAGAVGAVQTMTVSGAVLGDLVEASFSNDLAGANLSAWVSTSDTVKYQFRNPTAAPIDLGSGTVKCRVKK